MKRAKRQRLIKLVVAGIILTAAVLMVLGALSQNVTYFYYPAEVAALEELPKRQVRIGGVVKEESVYRKGPHVIFVIMDDRADVVVDYTGILPDLFREGQGVIAEGRFDERGVLMATSVLAKHDENYMPPDSDRALQQLKNRVRDD